MDPQDRIRIGVVGKPHGVRGGIHLDGAIDAPALVPGLEVEIDGVAHVLASRGGTDARPIVAFEAVTDRDVAAALRGRSVTARRADLTPLAEGEWFADDLVGLTVRDRQGGRLGEVRRLVNLPSVDVLEVATPDDGELLVPMISDAIVEIDPAAGVTVDAAFLDLV